MTMLGSDAEEQAHCAVIRPFFANSKRNLKKNIVDLQTKFMCSGQLCFIVIDWRELHLRSF